MNRLAKSKRFTSPFDRLPRIPRKGWENIMNRGQIPALQSVLPAVAENQTNKTLEQWKYLVGDKVLIVKGKYKGTVTKVAGHQASTNGYFLEDGPVRQVVVPKVYWNEHQTSHVLEYPETVPKDHLKLVGTMASEDTGVKETFAADDIVYRGKYWDENHKMMLPYRCVKNLEHITIPWPAPEPVEDDAMSTPEAKVLERTYFPTSIVHSGMPADLKESLRTPLAKRRTPRFAKKYITKSDIKRLTPPEMPEPEFKALARAERATLAQSLGKLTPDIEEFIGKRVAQHLDGIRSPHMKKYIEKVSGDK